GLLHRRRAGEGLHVAPPRPRYDGVRAGGAGRRGLVADLVRRRIRLELTERDAAALHTMIGETLDHSDAIERWRSYDAGGCAAGFRAYRKLSRAIAHRAVRREARS